MSRPRSGWVAGVTLAVTLACGVRWAVAAPTGYVPPAPMVRTLGNGMTVAVWADHRLPIVQMQLVVPAGNTMEAPNELGVANLTATLITRGTASRTGDELRAEVARLGGTLSGSAAREVSSLGGAFGAADIETGLELLADVALHPIFAEDALDEARTRQLNALSRTRQDPSVVADEHVVGLAYAGDPLGQPPAGTLETVQALTRSDVQSFYRRCWRPDRAIFAIAGDVDPERMFRAIEEQFGAWGGRAEEAVAGSGPPARDQLRIRLVDEPGRLRSEIRLALPAPGRGAPDVLALTVANTLLGVGSDSRLARAHAGLTPAALLSLQRSAGLIVLGTSAREDSVVAAVRALQQALRGFIEAPPSEAQVATTRAGLRDAQALQFETLGGLIAQWTVARVNRLPDDQLQRYGERMDAVDAAAVAAAGKRWFAGGEGTLVVAGPAQLLRVPLQALGTVEIVPASAPPVEVVRVPSQDISPPSASALQQGRAAISRALVAHGGPPALRRVTDSVLDGDILLHVQDQTYSGSLREMRRAPDRYLLTTLVQNNPSQVGMMAGRGWLAGASVGDSVVDADSASVADMRTSFGSDLQHVLLWAADAGTRVALRGRETVDARPCEVIEAVDGSGYRRVLFLDARDHRVVGIEQLEVLSDQAVAVRRVWGDYRPVAGVQWPYFEERRLLDRPLMTIQYKTVRLNAGLTDNAFMRPVPPKTAAAPSVGPPIHKP